MAVTIKLPYFPGETGVTAVGYSESGTLLQSGIALTESTQPGRYTGSLSFSTFPVGYYTILIYSDGETEAFGSWDVAIIADNTTADYAESIGELRARAANQAEHDATQAAIATRASQASVEALSFTGSGARTVTITVTDGSSPLASALVRVASGVNSFTSLTNNSGVVTFNLDDASWVVSITKAGYFYAGSTVVVDGTETRTLAMSALSFPSSPVGQVTGYWYAYSSSGNTEPGAIISISSANPAKGSTGLVLQDDSREVTANSAGLVVVTNLFPGSTYTVKRQGSSREFVIQIPSNASETISLQSFVG